MNPSTLGYEKPLFILAFDQRASFTKEILGIPGVPTEAEVALVVSYKKLIYQAFKKALELGVPQDYAALLCDEEFGDEVLRDAGSHKYTFLLPTEKSGQYELDFGYGRQFAEHIEKYKPTFVKTLIRYNAEGDAALNSRQCAKMKLLSSYAHEHGYKYLIEPLIPATDAQLASLDGDSRRFDLEVRPQLEVAMIKQIQESGVEVDVWKIEGLEQSNEYEAVVAQARSSGRDHVGVVVLGRHAPDKQIEIWLSAGRKVEGVLGFAIGRSIFWDPLVGVKEGKLQKEEAVDQMAQKYLHFYKVFTSSLGK